MKLSIAEVKRRLKPGTEYVGEFIGVNRRICKPGMESTRRKVTKNGGELCSEFLDGPKQGEKIYLKWAKVTAREENGSIILTMNDTRENDDFLKITIVQGCSGCLN